MGSVGNQPRVDAAHAVNILVDALVFDYTNIVFDLIALPIHLSLGLGLGAWVDELGLRKGWVRARSVAVWVSGVGR